MAGGRITPADKPTAMRMPKTVANNLGKYVLAVPAVVGKTGA
jgi:hypothetical protein